MGYEESVLDKLSRAERIVFLEESDLGREFRSYLEDVKKATVNKLIRTPAENKEVIMELQLLYKIADDFWNVTLKHIKDEGELAFHEARELGILPGTAPVKQ